MSHGPLLIVDDDPVNLAVLRQILDRDYSLMFARDGVEALRLATKHRPALVLLDIRMPGMDGYTVCRALKSDPQTEAIPVIFVTTLSDLGNEEAGFSVGCVDYIIKPVSTEIVRARVRTHLSLVRTQELEKSRRDAIYPECFIRPLREPLTLVFTRESTLGRTLRSAKIGVLTVRGDGNHPQLAAYWVAFSVKLSATRSTHPARLSIWETEGELNEGIRRSAGQVVGRGKESRLPAARAL